MPDIEIWGGLECTVARIRDAYVDQTLLNGHEHRPEDLDRFASLGITRLRYPVLWERVAPDGFDRADWRWTDERLTRLRDLGIKPIVTLVHHGSGPRNTSLLDPDFATGVGRFAGMVAGRYPWVDAYTPVNEPLTTARFSGLYGLWYPHLRDEAAFLRMLVTETRATRLAMAAIRRVNPDALLIQTEDLAKIHATPPLAAAAEMQNQRRWLSLDLLTGRVTPDHPFWPRLRDAGLAEEIAGFVADPCPPDIIGFNHYLSSERCLDHRVHRYRGLGRSRDGSNGHIDVEAVSLMAEGPTGPGGLLREAWERYRLPMAVTEVHNGSTREDQLRWLYEVWQDARSLAAEGVDLRAVTVWSLLGSYDWDQLLTRCVGYYEAGPFDVRAPVPRETALARMVRRMADGGAVDHPVLDGPGRWHRADRFRWRPVRCRPDVPDRPIPSWHRRPEDARRLLIVGATGTLGRAFARVAARRGLAHHPAGRGEVDIADPASVQAALLRHRPWAVINAAGFVRVDEAEADGRRCRRENAEGPAVLAAACAAAGIPLVGFSSDLVFDGTKRASYVEEDAVCPLNVYGETKVAAERAIAATERGLVVRTGAFFGPWDDHNFITTALRRMEQGLPVAAAEDVTVSPTYVPDLVNTVLELLIDGERGIWHLASAGAVTWAELAREAARRAGLDAGLVRALPGEELGWAARRPRYSVLGSGRASLMPPLDDALGAFFHAWREERRRSAAPASAVLPPPGPETRSAPTPSVSPACDAAE
ncbi:family 1 glycosylhydrolase [Azospirillum thermophilum]|uniref:dTDP-4-dehydrorhamnose reductase n=1 Tax=Azospirillum thermophilum TaxID=2202148 RepID=A0A2S2CWU5_9PROT|nr:family 1 glycosylhydrolase [Azospirillum thermophilum]AWK88747.1 dTDP-4-dehydrorhamnose reductase [Azospirillum thermophilum]